MFAIFENGGKQYKVSAGERIILEKLDAQAGDKITFKEVLLTADGSKIEIGQPFVNTTIEAKVLEQGRGKKIRVVKFKSKKRHHKVQGHRQSFTEVEILSIGGTKAAVKAPAKKTTTAKKSEAPAKAVEKKTITKKTATTKKATTKAPTKKATAAKKPAAKKA
jgi:large subunit ribosomal protein L21